MASFWSTIFALHAYAPGHTFHNEQAMDEKTTCSTGATCKRSQALADGSWTGRLPSLRISISTNQVSNSHVVTFACLPVLRIDWSNSSTAQPFGQFAIPGWSITSTFAMAPIEQIMCDMHELHPNRRLSWPDFPSEPFSVYCAACPCTTHMIP